MGNTDITIEKIRDVVTDVLNSHHASPWMGTEQAAKYIGCKYATLKTWRSRGEGPKYCTVHGKSIRYNVDDLDAFMRGEANR